MIPGTVATKNSLAMDIHIGLLETEVFKFNSQNFYIVKTRLYILLKFVQ